MIRSRISVLPNVAGPTFRPIVKPDDRRATAFPDKEVPPMLAHLDDLTLDKLVLLAEAAHEARDRAIAEGRLRRQPFRWETEREVPEWRELADYLAGLPDGALCELLALLWLSRELPPRRWAREVFQVKLAHAPTCLDPATVDYVLTWGNLPLRLRAVLVLLGLRQPGC
jgi:hypothetical protein